MNPQRGMSGLRLSTFFRCLAFCFLMVAVVCAPLLLGAVEALGVVVMRLSIILATLSWIISVGLSATLILPRRAFSVLLLLFLMVLVLSLSLSQYYYGSLQSVLNSLIYILAFFLTVALSQYQWQRRTMMVIFFLLAGLMGVYGVLEFLGFHWTPTQSSERLSSFYYNSNHYSGFLSLFLPLVLSFVLLSQHLFLRLVLAFLSLLLLFNLALTFSWGLIFTIISISLLFMTALRRLKGKNRLVVQLVLIVPLVGFALLVFLTPQLNQGDFTTRASELVRTRAVASFMSRMHINSASLELIADNPWLGVGPGNYADSITLYRPDNADQPQQILHLFVNYAHNDYLQIASESGLVALALYLGFWILLFIRGLAIQETTTIKIGAFYGLLAILLHGLSDGNLSVIPANALLAFIFAGLLHPSLSDEVIHARPV